MTVLVIAYACAQPASAADSITGQVLGAGAPIANSTVTLWAASAAAPKQLAQARTNAMGEFALTAASAPGEGVLYLVAKGGSPAANNVVGDNPAIALMTVLGGAAPAKVTINEMTTVASVWTHAQFLNGTALQGHALGLRIAAGNVPNFVDLATGGWGEAILSPLNSRTDPDDGQLRNACGRAGRLRDGRDGERMQQLVLRLDRTGRGRAERYARRGAVDCTRSVVSAAANLSPCCASFIRYRLPITCSRFPICPISIGSRAPGSCR